MSKKLASGIFCLLLFFGYNVGAQSIAPQVLNATGYSATLKNIQLTWNVGEMAVATLSSAKSMLTEGFLQPDIFSTTGIEEEAIQVSESITCYPNPVSSMLHIRQSADLIGAVSVYNAL